MSNQASTFDPDVFEQTVIQGESATKYPTLPIDDYTGYIDSHSFKEANDTVILTIMWRIIDQKAKEYMKRDEVLIKHDIWLETELLPDGRRSIQSGEGVNVRLGKLRAALGQNESGKDWAFSMLDGVGPMTLSLTHRPDKNDPETVYNNVSRVTPPAATGSGLGG